MSKFTIELKTRTSAISYPLDQLMLCMSLLSIVYHVACALQCIDSLWKLNALKVNKYSEKSLLCVIQD